MCVERVSVYLFIIGLLTFLKTYLKFWLSVCMMVHGFMHLIIVLGLKLTHFIINWTKIKCILCKSVKIKV